MPKMTTRQLLAVAFVFLLVFTGADAVVELTDRDDAEPPAPTVTQTVPAAPPATAVDGPDADRKRDDALPLDPAARRQLEQLAGTPTEATPEGDFEGKALRAPGDRGPTGVVEGPLAAQEFPGCRTRFVQNFSSRRGGRPQMIVWHQTVSRDRPGQSDQDALTAYANQRSSGVSWHLLIGRQDGLCTFSVPLNMSAWTQANANPYSIGIEVQAFGDEPSYVTGAGERKLLAVTRELGRRFGIPMRRGLVRNGRVVRSGIIEHSDLGAFGGGHADVTPWNTDALIAKAAAGARPVTSVDRTTCRKLNYWRRAGRPHGQPERNAIYRRSALTRRGVTCTASGPVRR